jgi:hypothetical protein
MDNEVVTIAKTAIAAEYGLSPVQARRLHGDTASDLRADAKAMRAELGLPELDERERDEHGRFRAAESGVDMNRMIRAAAGR